jgi:KipI family sensor histidine kinase inhibitor
MAIDCETLNETALLVHVGERMDAAINARVHALTHAIDAARPDAVIDVVPAYASVLVCHRPLDAVGRDRLRQQLLALADQEPAAGAEAAGTLHEIPVCYGGREGPDLEHVAAAHEMDMREVIERHCAPLYRVAMTGFAPGFPYLLGMDEHLATSRRATPRTRVAAGSVGIAGTQTGIYPRELPGGWQLIGRTPLRLFRRENDERPCLLVPGDRVQFRPIDTAQFAALQEDSSC